MQTSFMSLHVFVVMIDILMNGFLQAQSGGWVGCAFLCSKKFAVGGLVCHVASLSGTWLDALAQCHLGAFPTAW